MKSIKENITLPNEVSQVFNKLSANVLSDTKVLVAVSGGPDSMFTSVLIYKYFLENNFNLGNLFFIHCNHKTRVETDDEEKFIRSFFDGLNLEVCCYTGFDKGENTLREWRYSEFNGIIQKHKIDFLITGHNLTDRIESTFMNMCRGAGLNGFLSMKFVDTNNLIDGAKILRPLLSFTKKQIERLCDNQNIPYVTDSTNLSQETSFRNKIRLSILPQLAEISNKNDNISCSFFESMNQIYDDIESRENKLDIGNFVEIKKSPYRNADFAFLWDIPFGFIDENVLLAVLRKFNVYLDVTKNTLQDFLDFFHKAEQGYKYINGAYFFISNGKIYIIKAKQSFWEKYIEKEFIINKMGNVEIGKNVVNVDSKEFLGKTLRYPKSGDKYGSKSWGKYCINRKIPVFWRNFVPVIADGDQILMYYFNC